MSEDRAYPHERGKDDIIPKLDLSSGLKEGDERRRVYVACPTYERHEGEMLGAVYQHAIPDDWVDRYFMAVLRTKGCSLLAKAFNEHWVTAINEGVFDRFVLVHGDIAPDYDPPFIHTLWEEMDKHDLDVIHAVAGLKDNRGLTSTAIGPRSTAWCMKRRITSAELKLLPETFTIDDCMERLDWSRDHPLKRLFESGDPREPCLLPNTGCMMVRLRKDGVYNKVWDGMPGFVIMDRIAVENEDGTGVLPQRSTKVPATFLHFALPDVPTKKRLTVQCSPEDWNFGRWCACEELRVGGTTKVGINHWGFSAVMTGKGRTFGDEKIDTAYFDCEARH